MGPTTMWDFRIPTYISVEYVPICAWTRYTWEIFSSYLSALLESFGASVVSIGAALVRDGFEEMPGLMGSDFVGVGSSFVYL